MKKVRITAKGITYEGILLNSPNKDYYLLKLDSGYNIGVLKESAKLEIIEESNPAPNQTPTTHLSQSGAAISILSTGGTIASKVDYTTGAVHPVSNPSDLILSFPELKDTKFSFKNILSLLSENIHPSDWETIARGSYEALKDSEEGIIILHGTDTMHYSAAALSFALQGLERPIVFVGAQRSSDRPSTDARGNFLSAYYSLKSGISPAVYIAMHAGYSDDRYFLHLGVKARKMHTSSRQAFASINRPPVYSFDLMEKKLSLLSQPPPKKQPKFAPEFSDNVAMVYVYPGFNGKDLDKFSDKDGIVLIGTGLGHIPTVKDRGVLDSVSNLISSGVPVAVSSQCIHGRLNLNVYSAGRMMEEAGVIGNGLDWTPETAYVKLSWVLAYEKNLNKIRDMLTENMVGEFSDRLFPEGYNGPGF